MEKINLQRWSKWLICVFLAAVTLAAYAPVRENDFINFDDLEYVKQNPHIAHGVTRQAIYWAFSAFYSSNWHPLTWLSHALDIQLYGLNPAGHHLTSLAFHIANVVLLFLLFLNLTGRLWPSTFVALLFALHPLHVESVAWISERKDVLCGFFFLLTLLAYARYVELAKTRDRRRWYVYGLTLLLFAFSLMAKPMAVTLPFLLCLLDYWPMERFQLPFAGRQFFGVARGLVLEKIPFLVLTGLSCWITMLAQKDAMKVDAIYSWGARLDHASDACLWYLQKLFWPVDLSIYYPLHHAYEVDVVSVDGPMLLLLGTLAAFWLVRRQPCVLVGWFWFLGMLVPVIGIVQVGNQAYADRYTYLPYIGLFIVIAFGLPALLERLPLRKLILASSAVLVSAACFLLTHAQASLWINAQTLLAHSLVLDGNNEEVLYLLGLQEMNLNDSDKAVEYMHRSLAVNPMFFYAWNDLGRILALKGDNDGAEDAFQQELHYAWDKTEAYDNLGNLYMTTQRYPEAIANFQKSLALKPNKPRIQAWLGQSYAGNHQPVQAADAYHAALLIDPDSGAAHFGLAMLLDRTGRDAEEIVHYRKAIASDTNTVIALNNLAWLLSSSADPQCRDGQEAVRLAEHACDLTGYQEAFLIGTLANAYAEAGRFSDAIKAAKQARDTALKNGQKDIADKNGQLMKLYQSGQAYHSPPKTKVDKPPGASPSP